MNDHEWKILISAYADGELSLEDRAAAERVLNENPEARQYLQEIRGVSASLHTVKDAEVSFDLETKVMRFLPKEEFMEKTQSWRPSVALLTVCTLVILVGISVQTYVKHGIEGRLKSATDDIGAGFSTAASQIYHKKAGVQQIALASSPAPAPVEYEPYYVSTFSKNDKYSEKIEGGVASEGLVSRMDRSAYSGEVAAYSVQMAAAPAMMRMAEDRVIFNQYAQSAPGNTEEYAKMEESRFLEATQNPLSTFSIDVDTGSYTNLRRYLNNNQLPPQDAVRIEEMINYFGYDYPKPDKDEPFSITTKAAVCPWNTEHQLVLVGLKGRTPDVTNLPPSNLTFLLDISGSMQSADKLPLIQQAFTMMVRQLRNEDKVAIVVYAGSEGVALESTSGADKEKIINAIQDLRAGGSTAGGAGIKKAYEIAEQNFVKDGNNRVILATDGDFNVGVSSTSEMVRIIEEKRNKGIFLTVIGVGSDGNLKDGRLEQIADKGNGSYHYFDTVQEAKKVFMTELGSTLFTIAKDVKVQVEFNPGAVKAYRLIGYENRKLNKEDFNDDKKDAGELGAGHTVTALYEIVPAGSAEKVADVDPLKYQQAASAPVSASNEMLTVKLRYKEPKEDVSKLITRVLSKTEIKDQPQGDFAFASSVAEFGLLLRHSEFKAKATYGQVLATARASKGEDKFGYRDELIKLVETAQTLDISSPGGNMQFK